MKIPLNAWVIALASPSMISASQLQTSAHLPGPETNTVAWNTTATENTDDGQCKAVCLLPTSIDPGQPKRGYANARSFSHRQYSLGDVQASGILKGKK